MTLLRWAKGTLKLALEVELVVSINADIHLSVTAQISRVCLVCSIGPTTVFIEKEAFKPLLLMEISFYPRACSKSPLLSRV